jgi:hypothetical protein
MMVAMQKQIVHSNVDVGEGEIPWLHVVAPAGRGIKKLEGFARQPTDAVAYIHKEYNEMRQIAMKLMEDGVISKDDPILYPARGGIVAAQAIADVTGGKIYAMTKDAPKQFTLSAEAKDALSKAKHIILADDVIFLGNAVRKMTNALKDVYDGKVTIMANRMSNKAVASHMAGAHGTAGGLMNLFMPKNAEVYTGGVYFGKDVVKTSLVLDNATERGLTLESLKTADVETGTHGRW